ncbi:hypothetical protein AAE478_006233 [Parahypoxylon ruwenzoriense]
MTETERRRRRPPLYEIPPLNGRHRLTELDLVPGAGRREPPSPFSTPNGNAVSNTLTASTASSQTTKSSPRGPSSTSASAITSHPSAQDIESLKSRIGQLEEQLSRAHQTAPSRPPISKQDSNIEAFTSRIGGTFYVHHGDRSTDPSQLVTHSVSHKTRVFGQSHWVNGVTPAVRDILGIIEPYVREETCKVSVLMQRCKTLARTIKSRRAPAWPTPPAPDLPPKDVADELVDCYLRTVETVYRILHVPTFRRDYEAHWVSHANSSTAFLVQLKLVLAIGTTTYDELFSLRASAIRWIYEAQTWISEPGFKHRLDVQYIQIHLLLLLAREFLGVGGDMSWVSAGALLRTAMYMGLHKDPTHLPSTTALIAEMRRRLWNTILEISVQSSLNSGGSPLISLGDFDTEPPGNFDDDQLTAEDPVPKPEDDFTQTTVAITLRKTLPIRLAIAKFLNDHGSRGAYEETLRLDAELKASYKTIFRSLQQHRSKTGASPSQFEADAVSLIINRYLSALHIPFFGLSLHEAAYAFSRKVALESSLKIWRVVYPASSSVTAPQARNCSTTSADQGKLERFVVCANGFFRIAAVQATFFVSMELRAQLQDEEERMGPLLVRPDLLAVLDEAKTWGFRCLEAGETNIKGYFISCIIAAQIEALMQGLSREELPHFLIKTAEEAEERCVPVLEELDARGRSESLSQRSPSVPSQVLEDWDFGMSDALFDFGNAEPINWVFDEVAQEQSIIA